MNMYIAQANDGTFKIVKSLGRHRSEGVHGRHEVIIEPVTRTRGWSPGGRT